MVMALALVGSVSMRNASLRTPLPVSSHLSPLPGRISFNALPLLFVQGILHLIFINPASHVALILCNMHGVARFAVRA